MPSNTFLEGLMLSLSSEQKAEIQATDKEFVNFRISVFNAGVVVRTEVSDTPMEIGQDTWNGYDCSLYTSDVRELMDKFRP